MFRLFFSNSFHADNFRVENQTKNDRTGNVPVIQFQACIVDSNPSNRAECLITLQNEKRRKKPSVYRKKQTQYQKL